MTCPDSIIRATRGKAIRSYRDLTNVKRITEGYSAGVTQAAEYYGTATGEVDTLGVPDSATVLANASSLVMTTVNTLLTIEDVNGTTGTNYAYTDSAYYGSGCSLTAGLVGRGTHLANADITVRIQMARLAKRFAPAHEYGVFMDALKNDALWAVIRFALLFQHSLERLGQHATIISELVSLFTAAQTEDPSFGIYDSYLTLAAKLDITAFLPAVSSTYITTDAWNLADAVRQAYASAELHGIRQWRYEFCDTMPPLGEPPTPPSSSIIC